MKIIIDNTIGERIIALNMKSKVVKKFITLISVLILLITTSLSVFAGVSVPKVKNLKASSPTYQKIKLTWSPVLIAKETPANNNETGVAKSGATENTAQIKVQDINAEILEEPNEYALSQVDNTGNSPIGNSQRTSEQDRCSNENQLTIEQDRCSNENQQASEQDQSSNEEQDELEPEYETITYYIYRATSKDGKYKKVKTTNNTYWTNSGLTPGKTYYYKIKAKCGKTYSSYSSVVKASVIKRKKASLSLIKDENGAFNLTAAAGQKLYGYDTLQGACAYDGIGYFTLYNRKVEKCKIVKVQLSDMSVLMVSKPLKIYHANSITYNTKKNVIVAACCKVKMKSFVEVNPKTLTVIRTKTIKSLKLKGMKSKDRKNYKGFGAIAYSEKYNCYYARIKNSMDYVKLDANLKPVKFIRTSKKKSNMMNQAMDAYGSYIYDVQSFKGNNKYSLVTLRTASGAFAGDMKFSYVKYPGYELECIFHDGKQFYAGFYYSTSQKNDNEKNSVKRYNYIYKLNNIL